jgi:hypothetical protein
MRTKLDPDDEFFIPDLSGIDWSKAEVGHHPPILGEKREVCLDGAIGYELRLIPSGKVLGSFRSTLDAWPAIIAAAEAGRSPRTLSLDAIGSRGERWHMAAGPFLISFARVNNGEPHPYADHGPRPTRRRVAESRGADVGSP